MSDKCGTYAGWNQHHREGTEVCEPCRKANTEYMRNWRKENKNGGYERERAANRIRSKALWILADRHRREFDTIVARLTKRGAA